MIDAEKEIVNKPQSYELTPEKGKRIELKGLHVTVHEDGSEFLEAEVANPRDLTPFETLPEQKALPKPERIKSDEIFAHVSEYIDSDVPLHLDDNRKKRLVKILKPMEGYGLDEKERDKFKEILRLQAKIWNGTSEDKKSLKRMIYDFHDGRRLTTHNERVIASALALALLIGGAVGYKNYGRILSFGKEEFDVNTFVEQEYLNYTSGIRIEQKIPARALLVASENSEDYRLNQWLLGGFLLDRGLTNDEVSFFEPASDLPLTETKAYESFLFRNRDNPDLLKVMNLALENLAVDGDAIHSNVLNALENVVSYKTNVLLGLFSPEGFGTRKNFRLSGEELSSTEINSMLEETKDLIILGVGRDSSYYLTQIKKENQLRIASGINRPVGKDFVYVVEDMIKSYFENPEQAITGMYGFLENMPKAIGLFIGKNNLVENISFIKDKLFLEDGRASETIYQTDNGLIYKKENSGYTIFDSKTDKPFELNFIHKSFDDFLGVK